MGSKSLLGGISQDSTLRELIELMDIAQNDSSDFALPIRTIEEFPVGVTGKVEAEQPGLGMALTSNFDTASTIAAWTTALPSRSNRTGLMIWNDPASTVSMAVSFQDPGSLNGQGKAAFKLNPGDYWECPYKYVGPVYYSWNGTAFNGNLRMTEFF